LPTGGQKEFSATDKYTRKRTFKNWGKPCIWLNNQNPLETEGLKNWQREYIEQNCVIVQLEHRLYQPEEMLAPIFQPRPSVAINLAAIQEDVEEFQHADVLPMTLGSDRMEGPSRIPDGGRVQPQPVVIDENTVYWEDLYDKNNPYGRK
jgi:hypothetical protein